MKGRPAQQHHHHAHSITMKEIGLEAEAVSGEQGSGIEKLEGKAAASDSAGGGRTT
jgi:hypothetical protein